MIVLLRIIYRGKLFFHRKGGTISQYPKPLASNSLGATESDGKNWEEGERYN